MKRKTGAIVQTGQQYMGVTLSLKDHEVSDVQVYESKSLIDLKQSFHDMPYGIALDNSSGYLFNLTFPFSGKRKIAMVIRAEVEELLPFPSEDMVIDFKETHQGTILAAALPRSVAVEANGDRKVRYIGLQSLSALYALRWAKRLPSNDFVFLHFNARAVVLVGVREGKASLLRQFIHCGDDGSVEEALREVLQEPGYHPEACILVSDNDDRLSWKERIEKKVGLPVDIPSLHDIPGTATLPDWLWSGFGAALIALSPKGEVNLTTEKQIALPGVGRSLFLGTGCLAALAILVWGLFYLNYTLKEGTFQHLDSQPAIIYKSIFPKSGITRDIPRALQDKIRSLEQTSTGGTNNIMALQLLNGLSGLVDSSIDVKINDFTVDEKEISFSGTTVSFAALEKIKDAAEKLTGVSGIDLQNVELTANKQVRFKIRGKL